MSQPYQYDEYKVFSVTGGPSDFSEYLNEYNRKGWTLVSSGMYDGEWWAIMGRDNHYE